ncbi:uncharacterized protein K460DRAFT_119172 [Cucurbitaria berberidis CBS 394.84]|uniref:Uncharacterized protein n=1 Tax=Cucurbitaria berberidis CBS 394.84 TaxID=1168544 RepID=A0A9P4GIH2_9PLEO|nr:uncharacterized protein K460DRAFT_119172 [Cucurbitaria berberidis CBS 394.84]KAF1846031.1 hypothetical protein K460DRAFT_119172 [Cucurbitaria berberidis CBS 394.84]
MTELVVTQSTFTEPAIAQLGRRRFENPLTALSPMHWPFPNGMFVYRNLQGVSMEFA